MTRGGHRAGAGRPKGTTGAYKEPSKLAKRYTFRLYEDEVPYIKGIIKRLHEQKRKEQKMNTFYFNDKTEQIEKTEPNNSYTVIHTHKDYDTFLNDYEQARNEGNSIIDSIEWAK